jgi:hypothetical protein
MANRENGSLAAEAAAYIAGNEGAVGGVCGIQKDIKRQAEILLKWARQRGVLITNLSCRDKHEEPSREHEVYLNGSGEERVVKCTKPSRFGYALGPKGKRARFSDATPLFYLRRIELMNLVFGVDWKLDGIMLTGDWPCIVTSQPFIPRAKKNIPHASESEIDAYMRALGFTLLPDSCYNWIRKADMIVVLDTKIANFIPSPHGVVPIDLIIGQVEEI